MYRFVHITTTVITIQNKKLPYQVAKFVNKVNGIIKDNRTINKMISAHFNSNFKTIPSSCSVINISNKKNSNLYLTRQVQLHNNKTYIIWL